MSSSDNNVRVYGRRQDMRNEHFLLDGLFFGWHFVSLYQIEIVFPDLFSTSAKAWKDIVTGLQYCGRENRRRSLAWVPGCIKTFVVLDSRLGTSMGGIKPFLIPQSGCFSRSYA